MSIDAVIFDLGNTLISYYPNAEFPTVLRQCIQSVGRATGEELSDSKAEELIGISTTLYPERQEFEVFPLSYRLEALFGDRFPSPASIPMDQLIEAFMSPIFSRAALHPEATAVLQTIRQRGKKTGIVSNTPWGSPARPWRAELDRHGLTELCDAIVFCDDVGWRKPHPAPFQRVLETLEVSASRAMFVGDDPVWDTEGSAKVGMTPVLLATEPSQTSTKSRHVITRLSEVLLLV